MNSFDPIAIFSLNLSQNYIEFPTACNAEAFRMRISLKVFLGELTLPYVERLKTSFLCCSSNE